HRHDLVESHKAISIEISRRGPHRVLRRRRILLRLSNRVLSAVMVLAQNPVAIGADDISACAAKSTPEQGTQQAVLLASHRRPHGGPPCPTDDCTLSSFAARQILAADETHR